MSDPVLQFDAPRLERILRSDFNLGDREDIFVAFSGGLDSTILLHALVLIDSIGNRRITALHANHGLSEQAFTWEHHCRERCGEWGVRFHSQRMLLGSTRGRGTEALAREARYRWFARWMGTGSVLMTAHHLDDQVETVLANFFRGSGVRGLAGIRKSRPLARGHLWRPLLDVSREELESYAALHDLSWIEDPMNVDLAYTRNHIRHRVLPVVREKWQGVDQVIARSAGNWLDASELLDEVAESDLRTVRGRRDGRFHMLSIPDLTAYSRRRMTNALRMWFTRCGFEMPSRRHLFDVVGSLIDRQPEPTCLVSWPGSEVRRYRDWLYLSRPCEQDGFHAMDWDRSATEPVIINGRRLVVRAATGSGIRKSVYENRTINVRPRLGGESCQVPGGIGKKKLKKIYQEKGIPPWQRDDIPLLFVEDRMAGIAGICYCQPFAAVEGEPGMVFELVEEIVTGK